MLDKNLKKLVNLESKINASEKIIKRLEDTIKTMNQDSDFKMFQCRVCKVKFNPTVLNVLKTNEMK